MQPLTSRRLVAGATALLVVLTACGGDDEEAKTDTGSAEDVAEANDESTTTTLGTAPCTPTALAEAAAAEYSDAAITEQSCSAGFGIAVITASGIDESIAFFQADSGTWVFLTTGAVDASTGESLPDGFPKVVFDRWIARQLAPSTPVTITDTNDGDNITGPDNSIPVSITTTTLPPTTTTTAPPETTTTERQLDPYCIEFPEEASCLEDPYLP